MGVKLGKLNVKLVTETAEFNKGMQRSRKQVSMFQKSVQVAAKALKVIAAAAAAAAVALGAILVAGLKKAMTWADSLAKTADKLGATTEELAGMQLAAQLAGISVETMNMALQRMVRRVADAAQGAGPAAKALESMGLNARELNKMTPGEQLMQIMTAMEGIGNQGNKVRNAFAIFDSEGVSLVNLTAEGLKEAADAAERMGLALSRGDAKLIEKALDAITMLGEAFKGMFAQIAVQVAPVIAAVLEVLNKVVPGKDIGRWIGEQIVIVIKIIHLMVMMVGMAVAKVGIFINTLWGYIDKGIARFMKVLSFILKYAAEMIDKIGNILATAILALTKDMGQYNRIKGMTKSVSATLSGASEDASAIAKRYDRWSGIRATMSKLMNIGLQASLDKQAQFWREVDANIDKVYKDLEEKEKQRELGKKMYEAIEPVYRKYSQMFKVLSGQYEPPKTKWADWLVKKVFGDPKETPEGSASAREAVWSRIASGTSARSPEMQQLDIQRKSYEALKALLEETQEINNKTGGVAVAQ